MLDTTGPELFISNKSGNPIELKAGAYVTLAADTGLIASAERLPLNYDALAKVPSRNPDAHGMEPQNRIHLVPASSAVLLLCPSAFMLLCFHARCVSFVLNRDSMNETRHRTLSFHMLPTATRNTLSLLVPRNKKTQRKKNLLPTSPQCVPRIPHRHPRRSRPRPFAHVCEVCGASN